MGGLDALVVASGTGGRAPTVRALSCDGLEVLGIELEEKRTAADEGVISAAAGPVAMRAVRTEEKCMITGMVCRVLGMG